MGTLAWSAFDRAQSECPATPRLRIISPDSEYEAVVWGYRCGWFTKGVTSLGIGVPSAPLNELAPAITMMDTASGRLITGRVRPPWIEVVWINEDSIRVRYDSRARLFPSDSFVHGISIDYQPVRRAP